MLAGTRGGCKGSTGSAHPDFTGDLPWFEQKDSLALSVRSYRHLQRVLFLTAISSPMRCGLGHIPARVQPHCPAPGQNGLAGGVWLLLGLGEWGCPKEPGVTLGENAALRTMGGRKAQGHSILGRSP